MTLDLLIAGGTVIDGSGRPAFPAAVGVAGDRVACVVPADQTPPVAERVWDATGRVVCPGFLDVHTHADLSPFLDPAMESQLRQGVTSVVVGNCGFSLWPAAGRDYVTRTIAGLDGDRLLPHWDSFGDLLAAVEVARPACNVGGLVGHGSLRLEAVGEAHRPPDGAELARIQWMLREALTDGALGVSSGLIYAPGLYADTDELVAVAEALRAADGLYVSHVRGEGRLGMEAVDEATIIGRRAQVRAHVSHLKLEGASAWGRAEELLGFIDGTAVTADQYPYTAWMSPLAALLPPDVTAARLPAVMADSVGRAALRAAVEHGRPGWQSSVDGVGWERIVVARAADVDACGRDLLELAAGRHEEPLATVAWLLAADPGTTVVGHAMQEADVRRILADPDVFVVSDGLPAPDHGPLSRAPAHPRSHGTFARVLGRYVRDEGLLSLETAVRKMTALPAERFGLRGRGALTEGRYADVVVFDPAHIADRATFAEPRRHADGVELVLVNGVVAWDGAIGGRGGRALRRGEA